MFACVKVFDHLAESIYLFLKEENMLSEKLPLGRCQCFFLRASVCYNDDLTVIAFIDVIRENKPRLRVA